MPKRKYAGDVFTVYITPKGKKTPTVPNVVIRHKNTQKQINTIKLKDIIPFVVKNSLILKKLSSDELKKFKKFYGWT